jgi:uncharacterized tellurite resistance protein B-like protein
MRSYLINSPQAAGRILAITIIADGNVAPAEMAAMHQSRIMEFVDLDEDEFDHVLQDLCNDLLTTTRGGHVHLEPEVIDQMLREIAHPDLRRKLLQAMWHIADADGWLANAEAVLLNRASLMWGAETNFLSPTDRQARQPLATY